MVKVKDPEAAAVIKKQLRRTEKKLELKSMKKHDEKAALILYGDEDTFDKTPKEEDEQMRRRDQLPQAMPTVPRGQLEHSQVPQEKEVVMVSDANPLEDLRGAAGKKVVFAKEVPIPQRADASFPGSTTTSTSDPSLAALRMSIAASSTTRPAEPTAEGSAIKKARSEPAKRSKLQRAEEEMEMNIRTVHFGEREIFTVDEEDMQAEDPVKGYSLEEELSFEDSSVSLVRRSTR